MANKSPHRTLNSVPVSSALDREDVMKHWDRWRKYIAEGGKGSWPRDAFESLLDYYDEKLSASQPSIEAEAESRCLCPHYYNSDYCGYFKEGRCEHPRTA